MAIEEREPDSEDELYDISSSRTNEIEWARYIKERIQPRSTYILSYWKVSYLCINIKRNSHASWHKSIKNRRLVLLPPHHLT
jgi:hypothetical protein